MQARGNNPNESAQVDVQALGGFNTGAGQNRQTAMMNQYEQPAASQQLTQQRPMQSSSGYGSNAVAGSAVDGSLSQRQSSAKLEGYFLQKVVLITGASSGIGRALSFWYLNNGARVALVGREKAPMEEVASQFPAQSLVVQADLTEDAAIFDLKAAIAEKFGRLDILINCAGMILAGDLETTKPQDFDLMMDINLRTPFVLQQCLLEFLRASKGCIVNVSCDKGSRPEPGLIGYCMSKAGIEMLTKSSAMELAPFGIRVNAVAPSFVETNLYRVAGMTEPELDALKIRATNNIPMARVGTTAEVAKSIIFLTSEHALKMTGHVMKVDGGKSLTSRGQQDWYGWQYMNRKFEQESTSYYTYQVYKQEIPKPPVDDQYRLETWFETVQESRWAIKRDEAHSKYMSMYTNQLEEKSHIEHIQQAHMAGAMNNPKVAQRMDHY